MVTTIQKMLCTVDLHWIQSILVLFSHKQIILIGHKRETSKCVTRWIDFPLWYVERERSKRRETGTETEDWKERRGDKLQPLCDRVLSGLEELQRVRARCADEARIWALWNHSSTWRFLGQANQPVLSDNSLPTICEETDIHSSSSTAALWI